MQTTRVRHAKTIVVLGVVSVICALYLALRFGFPESVDSEQQPQQELRMNPARVQMMNKGNENNAEETDEEETAVSDEKVADNAEKLKPDIDNKDGLRSSATGTKLPAGSRRWYPVDARSVKCQRLKKKIGSSLNVTLIVDFELPVDEEDIVRLIDQLQTTIGSLLSGTGQLRISELLIVGHGSAASGISLSTRMSSYMDTLQLPYTKVIDRAGSTQSAARTTGVLESRGTIIIFSDIQVVGTVGWFRPLITSLTGSDSMTILQPHFDDASKFPDAYLKTAERLIVEYSWPLMLKVGENIEVVPSEKTGRLNSPAVRGNIFAVKRTFFETIGGYDPQLGSIVDGNGVAAHVELSLRTWMCGGSIQTEPCSRVGIRDLAARRTTKVENEPSAERIADLWFGDRKHILMTSVSAQVGQQQFHSSASTQRRRVQRQNANITAQRSAANAKRQCKDIDWYFTEVAKGSRVPSRNAVHFGQLRSRAGLCAHVGDDRRVDVVDCGLSAPFELTTSGMLTSGNSRCLTVQSNSYVFVEPCYYVERKQRVGSDLKLKQEWRYESASTQLVNPWSWFCAMHVTDPENHTKNWRQIVMAQNCSKEMLQSSTSLGGSAADRFTQWTFINV